MLLSNPNSFSGKQLLSRCKLFKHKPNFRLKITPVTMYYKKKRCPHMKKHRASIQFNSHCLRTVLSHVTHAMHTGYWWSVITCKTHPVTTTISWPLHRSTRMWANAQRDGRPAEYRWRPLFNGFRVLASLLHGTLVVVVSQTLRRWTEGATYIRQGGHHVGHLPSFLVVSDLLRQKHW